MHIEAVNHISADSIRQARVSLPAPPSSDASAAGRASAPRGFPDDLPQRPATGPFDVLPREMIQFITGMLDSKSVLCFGSTNSKLRLCIEPQVRKAAVAIKAELAEVRSIRTATTVARNPHDYGALMERIENLPRGRQATLAMALFQRFWSTCHGPVERSQINDLFGSFSSRCTALTSDQKRDIKWRLATGELYERVHSDRANVQAVAARFDLDDETTAALELQSRGCRQHGETLEGAAELLGIRSHKGIEALKVRSAEWRARTSDFRIDLAAQKEGITEPETLEALEEEFAGSAALIRGSDKTCEGLALECGFTTAKGFAKLRDYFDQRVWTQWKDVRP